MTGYGIYLDIYLVKVWDICKHSYFYLYVSIKPFLMLLLKMLQFQLNLNLQYWKKNIINYIFWQIYNLSLIYLYSFSCLKTYFYILILY